MASPTVSTQLTMPDPNAAPLNLVQLFQLQNLHLHSEILGDYAPYVLQNGEPDVQDQDKVWFELDEQGRPVATKIHWHGKWRRVYNGMLGEIRGYTGSPGDDFDATGWGKVQGEYDGWHLCNGNDGAPDFSDRFLLGAHMNNEGHSGYIDNEWVSWVSDKTGMHVGGESEFTLTGETTWQPVDAGRLKVGTYDVAGVTLGVDKFLWGKPSAGDETKNTTLVITSEGNLEPKPVALIPPFMALAWIIFLGYQT